MIVRFLKAYTWQPLIDIYNVGYGEEIDFYETAYTIRQLLSSKSEIVEIGSKGYIPFFLSNEKVKKVIAISENFRASLNNYLESIKQ